MLQGDAMVGTGISSASASYTAALVIFLRCEYLGRLPLSCSYLSMIIVFFMQHTKTEIIQEFT